MKAPEFRYFPDEDILHIRFEAREEADSQELSATVTAELDDDGQVIGLEIMQATAWLQQLHRAMGYTQPLATRP